MGGSQLQPHDVVFILKKKNIDPTNFHQEKGGGMKILLAPYVPPMIIMVVEKV
jgi:hypothetical protein